MNSLLIPSLPIELQQLRPDGHFGIEPLQAPVEWMRYCEACQEDQRFIADLRCDSGLIARCSKCGDERVVPFSRSEGETGNWEPYT